MPKTVTDRNSAPCNAEFADRAGERPVPFTTPETLHPAITESNKPELDLRVLLDRTRAYWTPPRMLTERRPAAEQMRLYAKRARYAPSTGPRRALGIAWCNGVAVPYTAWSRTKEWIAERPARFLVVAITAKCLSELPPVEWAVDNVIKPGAAFALWLFV
jgi:hypothetical protein